MRELKFDYVEKWIEGICASIFVLSIFLLYKYSQPFSLRNNLKVNFRNLIDNKRFEKALY